jgi:hypothetical protein
MHQSRIAHSLRPAGIRWLACLFLVFTLIVVSALAEPNTAKTPGYQNGFPTVVKIAGELCLALEQANHKRLGTRPVVLAEGKVPSFGAASSPDRARGDYTLTISAGCVELLNGLAHAKALDEVQPGYFKSYTGLLGRDKAAPCPPVAQHIPESLAWKDDLLNHQAGTFNQMAGALIAIELAHQYLGHYRKYSAQLADSAGHPVPNNSRLTEKEWREAVLKGARNSLDCGLGVDGLRCLLSAFDQMSHRPEWSTWFVHARANVAKLDRELAAIEREFFLLEK